MSFLTEWRKLKISLDGKTINFNEHERMLNFNKVQNLILGNPVFFAIDFLNCIDHSSIPLCRQTHQEKEIPEIIDGTYGVYSSGSTRVASLSLLNFKSSLELAGAHAKSLGITSKHTIAQTLPLDHAFGIMAYILTPLVTGCGIDFSTSVMRGPREIQSTMLENIVCHLVPPQFPLWKRYSGINWTPDIISCGADLWTEDKLQDINQQFPNAKLFVTYGLSQAGPRVSTRYWQGKTENGDVGRPITGVKYMIRDNKECLRAEGEGELCVSTPSLDLLTNEKDCIIFQGEKYLRTGDFFHASSRGLFFKYRIDGSVKLGRHFIVPDRLISHLKALPGIEDAAYIRNEHPYLSHEMIFFVVVKDKASTDILTIREAVDSLIPNVKWNFKVQIVSKIPRNQMGKIHFEKLSSMILREV